MSTRCLSAFTAYTDLPPYVNFSISGDDVTIHVRGPALPADATTPYARTGNEAAMTMPKAEFCKLLGEAVSNLILGA